jgi:ribosomal protein S12 methylthiotransferase
LGVFSYSAEEGTPAEELGDQVDEQVKQDRLDELMSVQSEIAFEKNKTLIGNTKDVIIDAVSEDRAVGRTASDCPEIDQEVYVTDGAVRPGEIVPVRIEAADGYDLIGTIVKG